MKAKDLANLLGVSPATISLVLNNKPGLSNKLRSRLTEQIIELGYGDMLGGKTRKTEKTVKTQGASGREHRPSIAFISYIDQDNEWESIYSFYTGVLEGVQWEARETGCNLVVVYRDSESSLKYALSAAEDLMGAIVICNCITPEVLSEVENLKIPCVFIDVFDPNIHVNSVNVDNRQAMYMIVNYLKNKGHRDIGYVMTGDFRDSDEDRRIAFRRALKDLHIRERNEFYVIAGNQKGPMDTSVLVENFRRMETMPTALVCENDREALRTINALKQAGFRVPEDVSVVGFDDNPVSRIADPKITTARSSRHRIGRECVAMVARLKRLKESETLQLPMKIYISTEMVERDSVADINQ